jgi:5'-nucleotidase
MTLQSGGIMHACKRSATLLVLIGSVLFSSGTNAGQNRIVDVQLLGINDFHGNLEPPSGSTGRIGAIDAGGVEFLATHIKALKALNPNTAVVSAGDLIGASPLLSALFHDEPSIEAMNLLGLDFNAVGNHEFDDGTNELLRMQNGGCHPIDGCQDGDGFFGADFSFLAANVVRRDTGTTIFPPYQIKDFSGAKIAFIGLVLEGAPNIVAPAGIRDVDFLNEAESVNALIPELEAQGVHSVVVLIHEGGLPAGGYNACPGISGPIVNIANQMSSKVSVIFSGHTHQAYNCVIGDKLVTSAASYGRLVTDVNLKIDTTIGALVSASAENLIVTRDVSKDVDQSLLIKKYKTLAAPFTNRIVGSISENLTRAVNAAGESKLGRVIADAQHHATSSPELGGAVVAFMNPGGIRTDLLYTGSENGEGDGRVTYGEAFAVQPFGNNLVTVTLTGAEIKILLEQQFAGCTIATNRILQVSQGFTYTWSQSGSPCNKVDSNSIKIFGETVDPLRTYRITVNSFLADGGDNFPILTNGTHRLGGVVDTVALENYFGTNSPIQANSSERIKVIP